MRAFSSKFCVLVARKSSHAAANTTRDCGRHPADPEQWLAQAQKVSGTWWEDWRGWLGERAGEKKPAPRALGNEQYEPGTPASGTYVFEP
jgi:poly(3-hydroxyalkanoate) synthetase